MSVHNNFRLKKKKEGHIILKTFSFTEQFGKGD